MNISELKKLVRLFEGSDLSEMEFEQEGSRIVFKKGGGSVALPPQYQVNPVPAHIPAPAIAETALPGVGSESPEIQSKYKVITSPMVGTYYSASSPTTPPYAEKGDDVREGDVLCIIEAMKLMNEIESEIAGKIINALCENGQPVEFGQPLFEIDPS